MKIIVTGATGFIGGALCEELVADGHSVKVLSRNPNYANKRLPFVERVFWWDCMAGPPSEAAMEGVEAVVNLAGERVLGRWTASKRRKIRDSRIVGTRNLVDGFRAMDTKPRILVSGSGVGIYGDRGDQELTEDASPGSGFLSTMTAEWESEAVKARALGSKVVLLRTGLPLGRDGGTLRALLPLFKLGLGGSLGEGRQWWPWVHLSDLVGLIFKALRSDWDGAINGVAPTPVRQREFASGLARSVGRPALLPTPAFVIKMLLGEFSSELLHSRRALPSRASILGYEFRFANLEAALGNLLP